MTPAPDPQQVEAIGRSGSPARVRSWERAGDGKLIQIRAAVLANTPVG